MSKKFADLIPGNSIYILCLDPITHEAQNIIGGIVDSINQTYTVLGIRLADPSDKSKMIVVYFRVTPGEEINNSLKDYKEHRLRALFETRDDAISEYIKWCESKIEEYRNNITEVGRKFIMP